MRNYGIYQPAQCRRALVLRANHLYGALALGAGLLLGLWHHNRTIAAGIEPANARCWQIEGPELEGYTPAHETEHDILHAMRHQSAVSLKCTGDIDGRLVTWTAAQIWIARGIPDGTRTGDAP